MSSTGGQVAAGHVKLGMASAGVAVCKSLDIGMSSLREAVVVGAARSRPGVRPHTHGARSSTR